MMSTWWTREFSAIYPVIKSLYTLLRSSWNFTTILVINFFTSFNFVDGRARSSGRHRTSKSLDVSSAVVVVGDVDSGGGGHSGRHRAHQMLRVVVVVMSGAGRQKRRRRCGRHEIGPVHSGRQTGSRVVVRRVEDMVLMIKIQRRFRPLMDTWSRC